VGPVTNRSLKLTFSPFFYCPRAAVLPSMSLVLKASNTSLKVLSGQIGSAWEWYHWRIGLDKDINRYKFFIFFFDLEYLIRVRSSKPLHAKMNPNSCLFGSPFALLKPRSFLQKCGRDINCSLDYGSWVKNSNIPQSKPK
jgi:hypothetical protein